MSKTTIFPGRNYARAFYALNFFVLIIMMASCNDDDEKKTVTISQITAPQDTVGATVKITGSGFSTTALSNVVQFNGQSANVTAATSTELTVVVPTGATTGKVTVAANGTIGTSTNDFVVLIPASKVYFTEYSAKRLGLLTVSNPNNFETLADNSANGLNNVTGIALDSANGFLYVTEEGGNRIVRMKKDGSGDLTIIYDSEDGVSSATSIALDVANNSIYWNNSGTSQIMKGDLTGTAAPVALYDGQGIANYSYGMAIAGDKLYFSNFSGTDGIYVGNLDGTGTPTILWPTSDYLNAPSSIFIDKKNGKIYWADESNSTIAVANLDGTGTPTILFDSEDGINRADGVAIDPIRKKIYWSETSNNVIARGNLDGSGTRQVLLENVESYGIVLGFE